MFQDKTVQEQMVSELGSPRLSGVIPIIPRRSRYVVCKTAGEWIMALVLLVLLFPLILLLAALVKATSPGPAFYRQTRLGRHGRPFSIYKLRTMTQNCEATTGPVWSNANDPRVTRIGRLFRDTHLDELPQLWNVLRGEMSLIGPRPERPELVARLERVIPHYSDRLQLRPGLTGLAQVQLPADSDLSDVQRKLSYDLYYVRQASFGLDVRILVCTVFHLSALGLNCVGKLFVKSCTRAIENVEVPTSLDTETRQVRTA
ncbi:MAG TPA: sugar transferase [Tepidisphaeraceae bacterium]|nr:sugar transferase [Tepidisphaeraceae bacterium]